MSPRPAPSLQLVISNPWPAIATDSPELYIFQSIPSLSSLLEKLGYRVCTMPHYEFEALEANLASGKISIKTDDQ